MLQGDILEDIALIENLEETKRTSVEIAAQVKAAKDTEVSPQSFTPWSAGASGDLCRPNLCAPRMKAGVTPCPMSFCQAGTSKPEG